MSSHDKKHPPKGNSTAALHQKFNPEGLEGDDTESGSDSQGTELLEKPSYAELEKKYEEAETQAKQHWERLLRIQADMDNAQRRLERDIANAHKYALEKFVLELLPVVDSMERSLETATEQSAVLEGVAMTLKMFISALEKFSVKQINPMGETFNPELHQAVSVQVDATVKPNTVIGVLQKGYLLNNRLIRPALVMVSKAA